MSTTSNVRRLTLDLEYPTSLGVYERYDQAQLVVDYLSDKKFDVGNVAIVGTELRLVERITGRLTRGRVAIASATSGAWLGAFIGLAFALFGEGNQVGFVISSVAFGAVFWLVWGQIGFSLLTRRGARDFSSVSQVVATKYQVLVEHRLAEQARELLAKMPGGSPPAQSANPT